MSGLRPAQNPQQYQMPQGGNAGPLPSAGGGLSEFYNFDVLDMLRRKLWLILFFVFLGTAASLVFFFQAPKTYRSEAKVFIDEQSAPGIDDDKRRGTQDTVEKHIEILHSAATLSRAIEDGKFGKMEIFEESESILRTLLDGKVLNAKSADVKSNSGVIRISFDGANPEETQKVLAAVVDSFGVYIDSDAKDIGSKTTTLWTELNNNILVHQKEVQAKIEELMGLPEILVVDNRVQNPAQLQQSRLLDELHVLERERLKLQAEISTIQTAQAMGKDPTPLMRGVAQDRSETSAGAMSTMKTKILDLKIREQELSQQYASNHPDLKNVRQQIAMAESLLVEEQLATLSGNEDREQVDRVTDFIEQMNGKITMINTQTEILESQIEVERKKAAETTVKIEQLLSYQRERDRLEKYSDATIDKLGEVEALEDFKLREMHILDPASVAEQVAPSLPLCLGGGLFLGSLLGFLFAGLKEMAEKTFRSSDDISSILNARVIGHVGLFQRARPKKDSPFANVAPEMIALHSPSNPVCEAYRSIRTSIFFQAQETGARVIQMTSPTPGDGKSTTISNVAASMAQSGRKVLLIDADLRKPRQHKHFGLDNDFGLTSVVYGQMKPSEAVQVITPEYLSVVTSGPIPPNPSELLTSERFEAIINAYREHYDFVLIDTPPLLAVTDPAIVCRYAELVFMVMRISNGVRSNSARAKEVLDSMGVDLAGVIINGLRRRDQKTYDYTGGKYGYGSYSYGGTYGSTYGKNYSNGDGNPVSPPAPNLLDVKSIRARS